MSPFGASVLTSPLLVITRSVDDVVSAGSAGDAWRSLSCKEACCSESYYDMENRMGVASRAENMAYGLRMFLVSCFCLTVTLKFDMLAA
jgi:hypothetical protein